LRYNFLAYDSIYLSDLRSFTGFDLDQALCLQHVIVDENSTSLIRIKLLKNINALVCRLFFERFEFSFDNLAYLTAGANVLHLLNLKKLSQAKTFTFLVSDVWLSLFFSDLSWFLRVVL